jgi:hypothetical protein
MAISITSLPPDLAWLHPAHRPTDQEVDAYAHMIANIEGYPEDENTARLHREAELQLWIWRSENQKPLGMQRSGVRVKKSSGSRVPARRAS